MLLTRYPYLSTRLKVLLQVRVNSDEVEVLNKQCGPLLVTLILFLLLLSLLCQVFLFDGLFHFLYNLLLLLYKRLFERISRRPLQVERSVFELCVCKLRERTARLHSFSKVNKGGQSVRREDKSVDDSVPAEKSIKLPIAFQ